MKNPEDRRGPRIRPYVRAVLLVVRKRWMVFEVVRELWRAGLDGEAPCMDCGMKTAPFDGEWEDYIVHDELWRAAGCNPEEGVGEFLCVGCLEARLGRRLTPEDFTEGLVSDPWVVNTPRWAWSFRTARLQSRLLGADQGDEDEYRDE